MTKHEVIASIDNSHPTKNIPETQEQEQNNIDMNSADSLYPTSMHI